MKVKVTKQQRDVLIQGYQNEVFLAERLKRIFCGISTENEKAMVRDVSIHNDFYDDLLILIAGKRDELLKEIAKLITGYMR